MNGSSGSYRIQWLCVALGVIWGLGALLVVTNLHVNPDNLRNVYGQPVLRTVYARDPGLWVANFIGIGGTVVIAATELVVRSYGKSRRPGVVAIVLGGLLCLYSLFGLLYGVVAIAPIGIMLILSGMPVDRRRTAASIS